MAMKPKSIAILIAICLCALSGCRVDKDTPEPTQADKDFVLVSMLAAHANASQTNWTVVVSPRTNRFGH